MLQPRSKLLQCFFLIKVQPLVLFSAKLGPNPNDHEKLPTRRWFTHLPGIQCLYSK